MNEVPRSGEAEAHRVAGRMLEHLGESPGPAGYHVLRRDRRSNLVDEVHLEDGRILVIKRAHDPANAYRFAASRTASTLLSGSTDVVAPRYLPTPGEMDAEAVLVYWWVPGATLHELWPDIAASDRAEVVVSWGELIGRIQAVELPGFGPIVDAVRGERPLDRFLSGDLGDRLLPAAESSWPGEGAAAVRGLLAAVPALVGAIEDRPPVVVHNDLFDQNVLCGEGPGGVRCVGALDFEDAFAGPPEAELAKTEVLHGPLFGQPWAWDWFPHLVEGWGRAPDVLALGFFRAYALVNMGLHAKLRGLDGHAARVAAAARAEVDALGSERSHRGICSEALR